MGKILKNAALISFVLFLSSCFIPQTFKSTIDFKEDSTFDYVYEGIVVNVFAASEKYKKGAVSDKTKSDIPKIIADMKRNPDTKSVAQVNETTFSVLLSGKNKSSTMFSLMDFIKVHKDKAGIISVFTPKVSEKNLQDLKAMGISMDGSLKITVPKNAVVIESNAQFSPTLAGLVGSYTWKLKKFDDKVILKFKINK